MTAKRKIQLQLDIFMVAILSLLMSYELIGGSTHEWLGIVIFFAAFLHHALNWQWHKNLMKGRYSGLRALKTTINVLIFLLLASLIVTGVILSKYIFPSWTLEGGMAFARSLHLVASYWCFLLISIHLGLYWRTILGTIMQMTKTIKISALWRVVFRIIGVLAIGYGVYAFLDRQIASYLFLQKAPAFAGAKIAAKFIR